MIQTVLNWRHYTFFSCPPLSCHWFFELRLGIRTVASPAMTISCSLSGTVHSVSQVIVRIPASFTIIFASMVSFIYTGLTNFKLWLMYIEPGKRVAKSVENKLPHNVGPFQWAQQTYSGYLSITLSQAWHTV